MRTTSAKPYEVVEGKPPFPARKTAANPGGSCRLWMRCVFAAYNFDSTYCNMGKFTAQSQNRASSCETGKNVCHGQNEEKAEKSGK